MADYTLEEVSALVLRARKDGKTEEQIANGLKKFNYTPKSFEEAIRRQSEKKDKGEKFAGNIMQHAQNFIAPEHRTVQNAIESFTWGNSIYLGSLMNSVGEYANTGEWNYKKNVKKAQKDSKVWRNENKVKATVSDVAGTLGGTILPVGALSKVAGIGKFGTTARPARKVLKDVVVGGLGSGTIAGAETASLASARDEGDIGQQSGIATLFGAGTGGILPLVNPVVKGTKAIWGALNDNPKVVEKIGQGWDQVKEFFTRNGEVDPAIANKIKEVEELKLGDDAMMVDFADVEEVAGSFLRNADPKSDIVREAKKALEQRVMKTKEKASGFITESMNFPKRTSMLEIKDTLRKQAQGESRPFYNKSFFKQDEAGEFIKDKNGVRVFKTISSKDSPELNDIFTRPDFQEAWKVAQKQGLNKTPPVILEDFPLAKKFQMEDVRENNAIVFDDSGNVMQKFSLDDAGNKIELDPDPIEYPVWALDSVKKHLDRKYRYAHLPNADPKLAGSKGDIAVLKEQMIGIMENQTDKSYAIARAKYRGKAELSEAFEFGEDYFKPSLNGLDAKYLFGKLKNKGEKEQFRIGAYNSLMNTMERAGEGKNPRAVADFFKSPQNQQKLELLVPDAKKRDVLTRRMDILGERIYKDNIMLKNSLTASREAMDKNLGANYLELGQNVLNKNVPAVASQAEKFMKPLTVKSDAGAGAKEVFTQGAKNIKKNLDRGSGLLTEKAMKEATYDPLNLLGLTTSGAVGVGRSE